LTDKISRERRSENMRRIRAKDTLPEMVVRRLVWGLGYRYRLHRKGLPGRPDLVMAGRRKVIWVHGCFWHCHEDCKEAHIPKSRREYWAPKLEGNKRRDKKNLARLRELGWSVLVIWECETLDGERLEKRLSRFLR
jgi:DNA mismatch endonuclease, patch repair protein